MLPKRLGETFIITAYKAGETWKTKTGKFAGKNNAGTTRYFTNEDRAKDFATGKGADKKEAKPAADKPPVNSEPAVKKKRVLTPEQKERKNARRKQLRAIKKALLAAGDHVTKPIQHAYKMATDKKHRKKVVSEVVKAGKKEIKKTKKMANTFKRMVNGKPPPPTKKERHEAYHQLADCVKIPLMMGMSSAMYAAGAAIGGPTGVLIADQLDDPLTILIDKPLRKATKRLFGVEHGVLPRSFYKMNMPELHAMVIGQSLIVAKEEQEELDKEDVEIIEKLSSLLLDELSKEDVDFNDLDQEEDEDDAA